MFCRHDRLLRDARQINRTENSEECLNVRLFGFNPIIPLSPNALTP